MEKRKSIGRELYKLAITKQLSENDLNILLDISKMAINALQKADHSTSTLKLIGEYLVLFSMKEDNPAVLAEEVLRSLSTEFRQKIFPKTT